MRNMLEAHLQRIERDISGLAVKLYLFTRQDESGPQLRHVSLLSIRASRLVDRCWSALAFQPKLSINASRLENR